MGVRIFTPRTFIRRHLPLDIDPLDSYPTDIYPHGYSPSGQLPSSIFFVMLIMKKLLCYVN